MAKLDLLPPVPRPPHDPLWLTLDAQHGWHAGVLDDVVLEAPAQTLALAVSSGLPSLLQPDGSLGGITVPTKVAVAADGSAFILDADAHQIKKFDDCTCTFLPIPHLGGEGTGPRQWSQPVSIAIAHGDLLVADQGNHRVSVFSLREYVLRGVLQPPPSAELANPFTPAAIAADRWGRVFVTDPANGAVHRFSRRGVWQEMYGGLGAVRHIAVDTLGYLYIVVDGATDVLVLDGNGRYLERVRDIGAIESRFAPPPFRVTHDGALVFPQCGTYDATGTPTATPPTLAVKYAPRGMYLSTALDSRIQRCQWHRIVLRGEIPLSGMVLVRTFTSDIEQPIDVIQDLPDDAWDVHPIARGVQGEWDCLIRSSGGRYLWLRLDLVGTPTATPRLASVQVDFPRISLRRYLPAVFGEDPAASDFTDRFLGIFDTTFREIEHTIDHQARLFDPRSTPASRTGTDGPDFLTWLGSWIGVATDRHWSEAQRREMVRLAPTLYDIRGTRSGLWRLLLAYLGLQQPAQHADTCECNVEPCHPSPRCGGRPLNCDPPVPPRAWQPPPLILEHYLLRRWLFVGAGRVGEDAVLWGRSVVNRSQLGTSAQAGKSQLIAARDPYRDPFHMYASRFTVFVPACVGQSAGRKRGLENLLMTESPAHAKYHIEYVQPRFRIGVQSMIGLDAVVGRYPEGGVTIGNARLGRASVLSEGRDGANNVGRQVPSMRIGRQARIGSTTRLD